MTTSYRIRYTKMATEDLRSIVRDIIWEKHAPETGRALGRRIRLQIKKLDTFPEGHEPVDWEPWASAGMHKLPVENYVVFYTIQEQPKTVSIYRILYGGRDLPAVAESAEKADVMSSK